MESDNQKAMEQAYDVKVLAQRLKDAGLDATEEFVAKSYPIVKAWLKESAKLTKPVADDIAFSFLDQADALVLPQIDKINGRTDAA